MFNGECRIRTAILSHSQFNIHHSQLNVSILPAGRAMKVIPKIARVRGTVTAPPSKSYSVRALLLAAMADETTIVTNCLDSDDTLHAFEALRTIGFDVSGSFAKELSIGPRVSMSANDVELFVGNAGTAMRFLTGWLSFTPGRFILRGEERMH